MLTSIHYKAFLEKIKKAKRAAKTVFSAHASADRMAVYMGNNQALTTTIYGHKIYVDTRDLSLSPHILLSGYWEKWISTVFINLVKPGMTVLDIGANVGFYSSLAAENIGPRGKLFCFEANPDLAHIVFKNLNINGFYRPGQCFVENKAVYSEDTELEFSIYENFMGSSNLWADATHVELYKDAIKKIKVSAITLDNYFPAGQKIDFIKVDAEGAEPYILKGAQRILEENRELQIMMEFAPAIIAHSYGEPGAFYEALSALGFSLFRIAHDSQLIPMKRSDVATIEHCDIVLRR